MARTPRQQQILAALEKSGKIAIADLAETFEVSDETIRRDLKILSAEGSVEKYHGGVRLSIPRAEPPFDHRLYDATDEKSAIATLAVSHVREGATVLLDNSSTACFFARALAYREPMTILTISLEVARILGSAGSRHRVIVPGGELRNSDRTIIGPGAIEFLSQFAPSYFVTSMVAGTSRGCFDFDLFEAEFKRAMIPLADQTMVLMDNSKFGKSGLIHVCDWSEVDILVTNSPIAELDGHLSDCEILIAE